MTSHALSSANLAVLVLAAAGSACAGPADDAMLKLAATSGLAMPPNAVAIREADVRQLVGWILALPANP